MLFQNIRYRLLLSYLTVLTIILGTFAIAVRWVFIGNLTAELNEELNTLVETVLSDIEIKHGKLALGQQTIPLNPDQSVQWFNPEGRLLREQGDLVMRLPFNPKIQTQTQTFPFGLQAIAVPIFKPHTKQLIGYLRVSESTTNLRATVRHLDWGLGGGVILALILSSIGSIWLTYQAMQPIETSFTKLQQFTADASHELRSPLMAIKSNAAVALKYPEGMRALDAEKFQAIASAVNQMTALTEDLLMLARTDQMPTHKQEIVSIQTLFAQLKQFYQPQADNKNIILIIQDVAELSLIGNPVQLIRLFSNLLDNALCYTPEKGQIILRAKQQGNDVLFSITDNGIGIEPRQLAQIFDRFWRADQARSHGTGGLGLGLAIAQSIVQQHRGKISATSKLGQGSCFTVQLPLHSEP